MVVHLDRRGETCAAMHDAMSDGVDLQPIDQQRHRIAMVLQFQIAGAPVDATELGDALSDAGKLSSEFHRPAHAPA